MTGKTGRSGIVASYQEYPGEIGLCQVMEPIPDQTFRSRNSRSHGLMTCMKVSNSPRFTPA